MGRSTGGTPFRTRVPWQVKILAKIVLSRLPVRYDRWRRWGLFRDGEMDSPEYAFDVFRKHLEQGGIDDPAGMTILELGPGDGVSTGIIAGVMGAERTYLVNAGDHAVRDADRYRVLLDLLESKGLPVTDFRGAADFRDLLRRTRTRYVSGGLASLASIPSASVDFIFSNAVLEHVRLREFDDVMSELRRVLAPGGVVSHGVDLRDHLNDALNNLRVPEGLWESTLFSASGFYTNRIRYRDMLHRFQLAGFQAEVVQEWRWEEMPTPRRAMQPVYRGLPEDELLVQSFDVVLRKG